MRWTDIDSSTNANALIHAICCPDFIVTIFCLRDMLSVTLPMSKKLQQVNIGFTDAAATVRDALAVIKKRRSHCNYFDGVFQSASEAMQDLNVPVAVPRTTGRQKNRANVPAASPIEYYRRAVFFHYLTA